MASLPISQGVRAAPTPLACLRCQLLGRRKLTCSMVDACKDLPHVYAMGPALMVGWLATTVLFLVMFW
jgi:hypothetical protein